MRMFAFGTLAMYLLLLPLIVQPACVLPQREEAADEATATSGQSLLASSKLLWPTTNGRATIHVCFLPLDLGGLAFPIARFAPDLATVVPQRKQWVREAVEAQWNARTIVQFVGWENCGSAPADLQIQLVSSQATSQCGAGAAAASKGAYCVEEIGVRGRGKRVFLNVLFPDEVVYTGRYAQTVDASSYDASQDIPSAWIPALCANEANAVLQIGTRDAAIAAFQSVAKPCLQNTTVHEFGHAAGFSHEQNRKDVEAACKARYPATEPEQPTDEDKPLGPFDGESIMSYCRSDVAPTLTDEDVTQTNSVYAALAPKTAAPVDDDASAARDPNAPGATADDDSGAPAAPKKKTKKAASSGGGCNGA